MNPEPQPYTYYEGCRVRIVTDGPEGERRAVRWLVGTVHNITKAASKDPARQWRLDVRVPSLDIIDGRCPRCNGGGLLTDDEDGPTCDQCAGTGNIHQPYTCRVYCGDEGYGANVMPALADNERERE